MNTLIVNKHHLFEESENRKRLPITNFHATMKKELKMKQEKDLE